MLGPDERDVLVEQHASSAARIARRIARRYGQHVHADDLVGPAHEGLIESAAKFDPQFNVPFEKWMQKFVRARIYDFIRQTFRQDPRLRLRATHDEATDTFTADGGGDSGDIDEAEFIQQHADARDMLRVACASTLVSEAALAVRGEIDGTPEEATARRQEAEEVRGVIAKLPRVARSLLEYVYFEGLSITDAGEKLGMQRPNASVALRAAVETFEKLWVRKRVPA